MEKTSAWQNLDKYWNVVKDKHLKQLLQDENRNQKLRVEQGDLLFDFSRQKLDEEGLELFEKLCKETDIYKKIEQMFSGEKVNVTEQRAVMHVALRAPKDAEIKVDGKNVVADVHDVLNRIEAFAQKIRSGEKKGFSGKDLKNYLVVGIGGSYLSINFVQEALRYHPAYQAAIKGRELRFVANVDPTDYARAIQGLNPEETLIIVNSKTFTTAETMLNARTLRKWLFDYYKTTGVDTGVEENQRKIISAHVCAASTNLAETEKFGIATDNVFGFWDWVGGRFSVWSAIGVLPLSLFFGFDVVEQFMAGGHAIDQHFLKTKTVAKNIPLLLGLLSFYQINFGGDTARVIVPYSEPLNQFVGHIQQLEMESNGKGVTRDGQFLQYGTTVAHYGAPGTNSQHSFFQLLHQGRPMGVEFIGYCQNPNPVNMEGEPVSNHDELMSNFFAQQDALACGRSIEEVKQLGQPERLHTSLVFPGDRASSMLLFKELNARSIGELLAIYEHRTAVSGFLWDINSFDQYGVELGKILGKNLRNFFEKNKPGNKPSFEGTKFNSSTTTSLEWYLSRR